MTGLIVGGFLALVVIVAGLVAYRQARGPTPRRREYLRMLRQYRAAKLALHDISSKTRAWRSSLDEVGHGYANDVTDIIAEFDRQALKADGTLDEQRTKE